MNALVSLAPRNLDEAMRFADMVANSDLAPAQYKSKPGNVLVAVQMGAEIGLSPMQALQNISVINGRPSVWGDAAIGLVRGSLVCEDVIETIRGEGEAAVATCECRRKGSQPVIRTFSVADAKKANLWGKAGPWQQYPMRMLAQRARGFALRDAFPDVLKGIITTEEARDIPRDAIDVTPTPMQVEHQVDEWRKDRETVASAIPLDLLTKGDDMASRGTAALREWWTGLDAAERGILGAKGRSSGPHMERWKEVAADIDKASSDEQAGQPADSRVEPYEPQAEPQVPFAKGATQQVDMGGSDAQTARDGQSSPGTSGRNVQDECIPL